MTSQHPAHVPALYSPPVVGHVLAPVLPADIGNKVTALHQASKSANTRRAYLSDWSAWSAWCAAHGVASLPAHPDTVSAYLADRADVLSVATLRRHLATIAKAHQVAGVANPCRDTTVKDTVSGLRRTYGTLQREAPGLLAESLSATIDAMGDTVADMRDRALLLVGWSAGLRRSELAGLTWGDIAQDPDGVVITLRRSKTDQDGAGRQVGIANNANPTRCPVKALASWRAIVAPATTDSPVFVQVNRWQQVQTRALSGHAVALVIQRRTQQAGLVVNYQGHSLRKGLVQSAYLAGVADSQIMATTGHQSVTMLRRYQGQAGLVSRSASKGLLQ
jgi:site-specific recombinase XerD